MAKISKTWRRERYLYFLPHANPSSWKQSLGSLFFSGVSKYRSRLFRFGEKRTREEDREEKASTTAMLINHSNLFVRIPHVVVGGKAKKEKKKKNAGGIKSGEIKV